LVVLFSFSLIPCLCPLLSLRKEGIYRFGASWALRGPFPFLPFGLLFVFALGSLTAGTETAVRHHGRACNLFPFFFFFFFVCFFSFCGYSAGHGGETGTLRCRGLYGRRAKKNASRRLPLFSPPFPLPPPGGPSLSFLLPQR